MILTDQHPGLLSRRCKPEAINDIIKTGLQEGEQVFSRHPLLSLRLEKILSELTLQQAVNPLQLLLLPKLRAVFRNPRTGLAMLPRRIRPPIDCAFLRETTGSLQKKFCPFSPAKPTDWTGISSQ